MLTRTSADTIGAYNMLKTRPKSCRQLLFEMVQRLQGSLLVPTSPSFKPKPTLLMIEVDKIFLSSTYFWQSEL
jgi:hypothetical protein